MTSRTPPPETTSRKLADVLREGLAPSVIRRKGAEGNLPASLAEKIEILVILTADPEEPIRNQALQTLENWDPAELQGVLADPVTPSFVLEFAAKHLAAHREEPRETTLQKIAHMTPAEKIKCALTGSQEERFILIRDGNKMVARAVLQSPKLSEGEIEAFASITNISEEALRLIASNRSFIKSYVVLRALVNNPRTPLDVTLPLVPRLNARDMKALSVNKNVPDALRVSARKVVSARESAHTSSYSRKH